jgi:ligand-binding SRPBCC domain-containing protein
MSHIHLETFVHAPAELCFDLARNIDVHNAAAGKARERSVAGVASGMIGLGETVTWEAVHFGVRLRLTSKITAFDRPRMFKDEMQRGASNHWLHTHLFKPKQNGTLMIDDVDFASPFGIMEKLLML